MPAIVLLGFMCSGKTTLGEALARAMGVSFIDLDQAIEQRVGMSIKDFFLLKGEDVFREIEEETLRRVIDDANGEVIALGGGTPCRDSIMEMLTGKTTTVWLRPRRDRLVARLMEGRKSRPLLSSINTESRMQDFLSAKLSEREPYYRKAQYVFDSSWLETPQEIAESVSRFLEEIPREDNKSNIISPASMKT